MTAGGMVLVRKAKHKSRIPFEGQVYDYFNRHFLRSIRSNVLQKLAFLLICIGHSESNKFSNLRQTLESRILEESKRRTKCRAEGVEGYEYAIPLSISFDNLIGFLTPKDIMEALGCQDRTAREYLYTLKLILHIKC